MSANTSLGLTQSVMKSQKQMKIASLPKCCQNQSSNALPEIATATTSKIMELSFSIIQTEL